nr:hypothetical protein [uncultured Albidiferax sp.]
MPPRPAQRTPARPTVGRGRAPAPAILLQAQGGNGAETGPSARVSVLAAHDNQPGFMPRTAPGVHPTQAIQQSYIFNSDIGLAHARQMPKSIQMKDAANGWQKRFR